MDKTSFGFAHHEKFLTRGYAPPEQYEPQGRQGTHTDLYALAATMYACLQGKIVGKMIESLPDSLELCSGHKVLEPIQNVSRQKISRELASAITKGLKCDPKERPQTVEEFEVR